MKGRLAMSRIEITGLNLGKVLAALYNNTQAPSTPMCHIQDIGEMTEERAMEIVNQHKQHRPEFQGYIEFDYVLGRPIKVMFEDDKDDRTWILRPDLYDRDSHKTVKQVVQELRD